MTPQKIALDSIQRDFSLQIRCQNDGDQIDNIREAIREKRALPPVDLFRAPHIVVGSIYYIGDGWHRILAAAAEELTHITAYVHEGGRAAALKFALGANAAHGLRRTNKDKRRALEVGHREFPKLSARALAKLCRVSHNLAADYLNELSLNDSSRVGADGKERRMPSGKSVQTDFWDTWKNDSSEVLAKAEHLLNDKSWLASASTDPDRAAGELEAFAEVMRLKAKDAEDKAAAIRIGAAKK